MSDVVTPFEFDHLVTSLAPLSLEKAGQEAWAEQAGTVERLSVGAVLQSGSGETELVAQLLADKDKVKVIVQHVIILETWRQCLLPKLLKLSAPQSSFPIYSVIFHEACCLSLLETAMFHIDVAQSLEDTGTDLLDYCVRNMTHLLYPIDDDVKNYADERDETLKEVLEQVKELRENIGLRSVSILRYMTDHMSVLSLGVLSRLVTTHDTPGLVAATIQSRPWIRDIGGREEVWRDGMWHHSQGNTAVEKMEFVAWLCLYNILSCKEIMEKYELNDFRISVLTKLQGKLHDHLMDQLPMMAHLKKWLAQISIAKPPAAKPTLIMELIPQIKESVEKQFEGRWEELAEKQRDIFLGLETELMRRQAERISETFGMDTVEQLLAKAEAKTGTEDNCVVCGKEAKNRYKAETKINVIIAMIMTGAQDARNRNTAANLVSRVTGRLINQSAASGETT